MYKLYRTEDGNYHIKKFSDDSCEITHSTKPLSNCSCIEKYKSFTDSCSDVTGCFGDVIRLDLNEINKLVNIIDNKQLEELRYSELYDKKQKALNFKGQVAGRHPDDLSNREIHSNVIGFVDGYNFAINTNLDKKYTLADMILFSEYLKSRTLEESIQLLSPKNEWDVNITSDGTIEIIN